MRKASQIKGKYIAIDTETTGLDPWAGARIFCWAYFTDKGEYAYLPWNKESKQLLKDLLNDPTRKLIFHNAKYDMKMMHAGHGLNVLDCPATIHCTMTMSKVLNSTALGGHDLETTAPRYLGVSAADKRSIADWVKANNKPTLVRDRGYKVGFQHAPEKLVKSRVLWDVEQTLKLFFYLRKRVESTCPDLYETERELIRVCVDMETHGVQVDITRARQLKKEAQTVIDKMQHDLNELLLPLQVERTRKGEKFIETVEDKVNMGSQHHMVAAFNKLGIRLVHKTKPKKNKKTGRMSGGGNWCFDEYAMVCYSHPKIAAIIRESGEDGWPASKVYDAVYAAIKKYKLPAHSILPPFKLLIVTMGKMISTYYNAIIDRAVNRETWSNGHEVGVLHCTFNPSEAKTGRFSSSQPNLQNIPRILGPRECFITRKSRRNWHLDYSQVEMRFFCHFAKDKGMAAAIDKDVHLYVATRIYKKPAEDVTKEQRKRAKATNFGILYGSGANRQADTLTRKGLPTTKMEAAIIVAAYHREFPSVKRLTNELKSQLIRNGYVANLFGRRYYIPTKLAYKMINYMCQGSSADLIKAAMVKVWKFIRKNGFKSKLILTVHDELIFECVQHEEARLIPAVIRIMQNLTDYFVPITVEAEVAPRRWSDKRDPVKDMKLKWAADMIQSAA